MQQVAVSVLLSTSTNFLLTVHVCRMVMSHTVLSCLMFLPCGWCQFAALTSKISYIVVVVFYLNHKNIRRRRIRVNSHGNNNSSPPGAAYMRQWNGSTLVQIMAGRHSAPSHYLNQCWVIVNWTGRKKFSDMLLKMQNCSLTKMVFFSAKWRPFCRGRGGSVYSVIEA